MAILTHEQAKAASHDERYGTGRAALYESHEELRELLYLLYRWTFLDFLEDEGILYAFFEAQHPTTLPTIEAALGRKI